MNKNTANILWFKEIGIADTGLVGGKNASLGEMYRTLSSKNILIPNGFAITAAAYRYFLKHNDLDTLISQKVSKLNTKNIKSLNQTARDIQNAIVKGDFPKDLEDGIRAAYAELSKNYSEAGTDVAVRSSATAEDLPGASFAGQHETYLNISKPDELLTAIKKCFASLFKPRAISYRADKGFDQLTVYLSVGVQKMVRSDLASSGVIFTLHPDSGFGKVIVVNGSWGLGELVVQGEVVPDEFIVFKDTLDKGYKAVISKTLGNKNKKLIYFGANKTKLVKTSPKEKQNFILTDDEILTLAKWAYEVEKHYSAIKGKWQPMDLEWAKDGKLNKLFLVQARPETIFSSKTKVEIEEYRLKEKGEVITKGIAIGSKVTSGRARLILNPKKIGEFKPGEILVTTITDPDWEPIMKIASGIVTDSGGRTSHTAIVSRELGILCIVGTENATKVLKTGTEITLDCSSGEDGTVYGGKLEFVRNVFSPENFPKTKTKVMVNIGTPEEAFKYSFLPTDGVGLAREEFIIASEIKIHPLALLNLNKLPAKTRAQIKKTIGLLKPEEYYLNKLAYGIAKIAAGFYPRPVIIRFSDFKTNEYAKLLGGEGFEPREENPMIGWRGASRYYDPRFKEAFGLECAALKKVRDEFGLVNLIPMIPFCRTPEEGRKVLETMKEFGLERRKGDLKVYMMCEIPSNVILADEFLDIFDGLSIGSNDLTQLTVGIDRDNEELKHIADERNAAVKRLVETVVKKAKERGKYIGICGQAPSDYPEFAKFLVDLGIESISLNPDTVVKTTLKIAEEENK